MTASPVMGVTDELVAELESVARGACQCFGDDWFSADSLWSAMDKDDAAYVEKASPWLIRALLAERAELRRDAERYRFWRYMATHEPAKMARTLAYYETTAQLDAAIDAAMQSEAKP